MSAVVLRCPNCGTTGIKTGECEACHEAEVRYYCTRHRPGVWLDGPTCGQCGSRFGASAPPSGTPARTPPSAPPRAARPTRPPVSPAPTLPPDAERGRRGPFGGRPAPRRHADAPPPLSESFDALDELLRTTTNPGRRHSPRPLDPEPSPVRSGPSVGGCLLRLFLLMMLLFVGGIGAMVLFGGALLSMFGFY